MVNSRWSPSQHDLSHSISAHFACLSQANLFNRMKTTQQGLSSMDVAYRRQLIGLNELTVDEKDSLIAKFLEQFKNPLILLLFGSAALSILLGHVEDAISITMAIIIVISVAFVQEYRSEQSLQALNKLVPHYCHVYREGHLATILAIELVPGDIVRFATGDRIPADATDLEIDESSLTGENNPSKKHSKDLEEETSPADLPLAERRNIAFMGTLVRNGSGLGIVIGTGKDTEFGVVFMMMKDVEVRRTPLQEKMDLLAKQLSMVSIAAIIVIMFVGIIQKRDVLEMMTIGVSLAVAAIPEGLPIVVTVTLALGVLRMSKKKAIIKKLPTVEGLGNINVICADKTGTLTMNKMYVSKLYTLSHQSIVNLDDIENPPNNYGGSQEGISQLTSSPAVRMLLKIGNLCNNAHIANEQHVGQPTEIALLELLPRLSLADERTNYTRISETSFTSEKKYMSTQCSQQTPPFLPSSPPIALFYTKGAIETVLPKCTRIYINEFDQQRPLDDDTRSRVLQSCWAVGRSEGGLRVVGMAVGKSEDDLAFVGKRVKECVLGLAEGKVRVVMITGDSEITAIAIAQRLGIYKTSQKSAFSTKLENFNMSHLSASPPGSAVIPMMSKSASLRNLGRKDLQIMSGPELDAIGQRDLEEIIDSINVFYRTTPKHKMVIVKALQGLGNVVAMTGDGVNDAPALRLADIGISMGKSGTDVSKEAADMILVDDEFSTILYSIEEGKSIFSNIQNFLRFQLSTSIAAVTIIALSTFLHLQSPLNAMQILWINILCDGPVAQSLGVEEVDPDVMTRPPRPKNDPIITKQLIQRILLSAFMIVAGTMTIYISESHSGTSPHSVGTDIRNSRRTTMTFTCFVLFDMFNSLTCRSTKRSVFSLGIFSNKMYNIAVSLCLFGQLLVIYTPFLQAVFQTEAISLKDLVKLTVLASAVLWVDEGRKWMKGRRRRGVSDLEAKRGRGDREGLLG